MTAGLWPALLAALLGRAGLHEGRSSEGQLLLGWTTAAALTGQNAVYCWIGLLCFVLLAYLTNPSDASFRAHLTDLSFRLHLKRLQAAEPDPTAAFSAPGSFKKSPNVTNTQTVAGSGKVNAHNQPASAHASTAKERSRKDSHNGQASTTATGSSAKKQQQQQLTKGKTASINGDNGRPHVLSFSNRVTISLKTPSYIRTSYGLFSTVKILPAPLPTSQKVRGASQSSRKASLKGKKLNTTSATGSSASPKSDNASGKKRTGFVSSLANNLASIATNPWVEQGGYFVGVLGYWWTIDDGTSTSGAREKKRTANAILAVEEQVDDEVSVSEYKLDESRSPQSLEDGHVTPTDSTSKQTAGASTLGTSDSNINGTSSGAISNNNRSKHIQRLANNNSNLSLFRAGQRRSSPTPRLVVTSNNTRNTAKRANSGEVSPLPVSSPDTASANQGESSSSQRNQSDPLDVNADKNLPGLPFHVDASARNAALSSTGVTEGGRGTSAEQAIKLNGQASVPMENGAGHTLATVSHTAPAADQDSSTVSPACALLQNQLDELRATTETTQARLNSELEELRARKADEDNVRTELKSRMKNLEEVKRSAEQNRLEAEKKLISARAQKKTVEDRVTKAKNELSKVEKREKEHHEKAAKSKQERAERLAKLREDVNAREEIVEKEVEATERLSNRVQQLEEEIEERKGELVHLRDEAAQAARLRMNTGRGPPPMPAMLPRHPSSHPASNSSPNLNSYYENASSAGMPYSSVPHPHPHSHAHSSLPSEDSARPASPARTPPGFTSAQAISGPAASVKGETHNSHYSAPFGNSFLEHRLQHRRPPAANASMPPPNASGVIGSNLHSNALGNTASSASSLYHRQLREGPTSYGGDTGSDDMSGILGTFAPFGPPGSPDLKLLDGLKELGQDAFAEMEKKSPCLGQDASPASGSPKKVTPPATSALGKPGYLGGIGSHRLDAPQLERKNSGSSESSSIAAANLLNPLSPMTPHQASLIPSQLFDMLDDVEMPTSPSPTLTAAHQAFSHGINRHNSDEVSDKVSDKARGDASPVSLANRPINIGGTASAWDTLDDFPFDAPMSSLSRKVSNSTQTRVDPKNFSSQSPIGPTGSARDFAVSPPESNFSHGTRSTTSTGETLSPSLTSATSQLSSGKNSVFSSTSSSSPHEYSLFEKARHALSLNPDAKAFNFNRPLPASSSFGQLRPQASHQDAKAAFEGHGVGSMHVPPGLKPSHNASPSTSSLELGGSTKTWASPIGTYRGIPSASSNTSIGGSNMSPLAGSASAVGHGKPSSPSTAAASNAPSQRTTSAGSSFSPFDDDDLLRGW